MNCACDDTVLDIAAQAREISYVAGDAHGQVLILLWIVLCIAQCLGRYDIELAVMDLQINKGPDHLCKTVCTGFAAEVRTVKAHVECLTEGDGGVVDLADRAENSRGAAHI